MLKANKRVSETLLAQPQAKRSKYETHVEETYICVICHETEKLMCLACPEHFACVSCMTKLISRTGKYTSCPMCRHQVDENKQPTIWQDEDIVDFECGDTLLPPLRDIRIMCGFPNGPISCPDCDDFSGSPREVFVHMLGECCQLQIFCNLCHVETTRADLGNHIGSGNCRNKHCLHNDDCEFMLYGGNDEKSVALANHHELMHNFYDDMSVLAAKIEQKMGLVENITVVNFRIQRIVDHLHQLYVSWTISFLELKNDCLSSVCLTDEFVEMRINLKKTTNRLLSMLYALTIMFENEVVEEREYEVDILH